MRDSFATTCQVGTTLSYHQCKPEKKNGQEKSFAAPLAAMVDRDIISMVDTPHTRDKRRMANLISWLFKKSGNGPKRHTGRDEIEIRYPVRYCFLWILRRRRTSRLQE
jgi:hypothetical protein